MNRQSHLMYADGLDYYAPVQGPDGQLYQVRPQMWRLYLLGAAVLFGAGTVFGIMLENGAPHSTPSVNVCRADEVNHRLDCVAPNAISVAPTSGVAR